MKTISLIPLLIVAATSVASAEPVSLPTLIGAFDPTMQSFNYNGPGVTNLSVRGVPHAEAGPPSIAPAETMPSVKVTAPRCSTTCSTWHGEIFQDARGNRGVCSKQCY